MDNFICLVDMHNTAYVINKNDIVYFKKKDCDEFVVHLRGEKQPLFISSTCPVDEFLNAIVTRPEKESVLNISSGDKFIQMVVLWVAVLLDVGCLMSM